MNLEEIIKILKLYKDNPSIMDDDNYTETIVNTFESMINFSNEFEKITEQIDEDTINKFVDDLAWTKFDYIYNNKKELFNYILDENGLSFFFPELTPEILDRYGKIIIYYCESESRISWNDSNLLIEFLVSQKRYDLLKKVVYLKQVFHELRPETRKKLLENLDQEKIDEIISQSFHLEEIFPHFTHEILEKYGSAIIKNIETTYFECIDENLIDYLFEQKRIDLIRARVPNLTEEMLKKYGSLIIDHIENNDIRWWANESLFKYLAENNRFDLIEKIGIENVIPELNMKILNEYGSKIIEYLEKIQYTYWKDKCLLEYLKEKERFDLIEKMNLYAIFPNLTEEILNEYGLAIIKYLEDENYCLWSDKCLLEYLIRHNRMDLIKKLNFDISSIEAILPILENIYNIPCEVLKYKINYLYNRNDEIFSTLNFEILKLNIPLEILLTITLYPEMQEKIINLDNVVSSKLFEIIKKVQSKKYDTVQVTESILKNASNYEDLLNNLDINSLNENELNNLIYVLQNENNIFNISSIEDLKEENFKKKKDIYFRNIDNNLDNLALDDLKEAIVESIYGISLERAKFISDRYSYDFDVLRKDGLDEKIITIVENLNKIVNETDISKLKVIYQTRNDISGLETDFMSSLSLEASIREEYARMYSNTLYKVNENDLSKNQKLDNVTYQGKKIEIYEPRSKFNMQIHALGAYSSFSRPDNFKDDWLKPKIAYHGICTSYIANNEIATARQKHPILGFSNYEEKALLLAGNYDLGSDQANLSFATSNYKSGKFLPPKTMIDATRHNHNEMVIERMKHDSGRISKRTPNYIIYIIDDMNKKNNFDENNELYQENLQAAYDFDIPIVVVDRLKYAKLEKERCDLLEREFNNSRDPETLRELFLNYMDNWVGCRYFETNPKAEYNDVFNDKVVCEFYKRITDLIKNDIHKVKDITKTNEEILMMIRLLQHERDCRVLDTFNGKQEPFSIQESLIEYQELLKEFKSKLTLLKQNEVTQDVVLEENISKTM